MPLCGTLRSLEAIIGASLSSSLLVMSVRIFLRVFYWSLFQILLLHLMQSVHKHIHMQKKELCGFEKMSLYYNVIDIFCSFLYLACSMVTLCRMSEQPWSPQRCQCSVQKSAWASAITFGCKAYPSHCWETNGQCWWSTQGVVYG